MQQVELEDVRPAVEPVAAANERVSWPQTSWASKASRSRSESRARACATADCSSPANNASSGAAGARRSTTRCRLRLSRSSSRHIDAITFRAVTIA